MLSNEYQRFLTRIVLKIQSKWLKTIQNEEDAVKEDVAKIIHEFEEKSDLLPTKSCKRYLMKCQRFLKIQSKWLKTVQSEEDAVKEDVAKVIHEFTESIKNKKVTTKQKL